MMLGILNLCLQCWCCSKMFLSEYDFSLSLLHLKSAVCSTTLCHRHVHHGCPDGNSWRSLFAALPSWPPPEKRFKGRDWRINGRKWVEGSLLCLALVSHNMQIWPLQDCRFLDVWSSCSTWLSLINCDCCEGQHLRKTDYWSGCCLPVVAGRGISFYGQAPCTLFPRK